MGNRLSCFSKRKNKKEDPSVTHKPKDPNKIVSKNAEGICTNDAKLGETELQQQNNIACETVPNLNNSARDSSPAPVVRLIPPAPKNYKLPEPLSSIKQSFAHDIKPPLDRSKYSPHIDIQKPSQSDTYIAQTVDPTARKLAQSESKPACWTDLHWALIGERELKTDEQKLRALFSWLCSLNIGRKPFYTYEELEQAKKDGVQYADEALARKSKQLKPESLEYILNDLVQGKATYLQAFEALCLYTHIPCVKIQGLAKGVDYIVGMRLSDQQNVTNVPMSRLQHVWNAAYMDGQWALFDPIWAAQRLAANAKTPQSQLLQASQMEYETDMFYYDVNPGKFIYSHFPTDPAWQLLNPPVSLKQFEDSVLLKPAFFRHGLGLLSHQDCIIAASNKLVVKLALPKSLADVLQFTFNLKYDEKDDTLDVSNLSRLGIHELSKKDGIVTFHFRFPKPGAYKLTLYAQKYGEKLFSDICEYRVESRLTIDSTQVVNTNQSITIPPFPPTSQAHYGVAEKGTELGLVTIPPDLETRLNCKTGVIDVKFTVEDKKLKLPRLTARLKSLLHDTSMLIDCLLIRTITAACPTSISSLQSYRSSMAQMDSTIDMIVITAFLPTAGEYALEVYGAPADADEDTSYFLVWQFLIDSDLGYELSSSLRERMATITFGPQDEAWHQLSLDPISHLDPFIRVPTQGTLTKQTVRTKSEIMQQYMLRATDPQEINLQTPDTVVNGVIDVSDHSNVSITTGATAVDSQEMTIDPNDCDLKISFKMRSKQKLHIVGQMIDISTSEEEDCTLYLLQKWDETDDPNMLETLNYLIRIPKGDHFYKLYLYGTVVKENELLQSLPLVYTYLIQAPARLMASELPYIGVKYGPFPEKLQKQANAVNKT